MVPSADHVLRLLAPVPPSSRVLDVGGYYTIPLTQLGFEVYARVADGTAADRLRSQLAKVETPSTSVASDVVGDWEYPDDFFDWVVLYDASAGSLECGSRADVMRAAYRVLKTGGWIAVAIRVSSASEEAPLRLTALMTKAGFVLAEAPATTSIGKAATLVRGVYRKVGSVTPV